MTAKVLFIATSAEKLGSDANPTGCWCGDRTRMTHFILLICALDVFVMSYTAEH